MHFLRVARVDVETAKRHVDPVAARDFVSTSASACEVVAGPTEEVVVAILGDQPVGAGLAPQIVAPSTADQEVWTPPADEVIVSCKAEDPVSTRTAADQLDIWAAVEAVPTRAPARQIVDVCETVEGLVSESRVVAGAAEDPRTVAIRTGISPGAAFTDPIVAPASKDVVSAAQQVVSAKSMDLLSEPPRKDHIWPSRANQPRSTPAAHNRGRLAETSRPGAGLGRSRGHPARRGR